MSETVALLKVGCRVLVPSKGLKGTVLYLGNTGFSTGKWVGINLDEPKGKNNGTVQDKFYFEADENHGMFVRQTQVIVLDDNDIPILDLTEGSSTLRSSRGSTTRLSSSNKRTPVPPKTVQLSSRLSLSSVTSSASKEDLTGSTVSLTNVTTPGKKISSFTEKGAKSRQIPTPSKKAAPSRKMSSGSNLSKSQSQSGDFLSGDQTGFVETLKPQFTPGQVLMSPGTTPSISGSTTGINMLGGSSNISLLQQEIEHLREQLKDVQEKYDTIKIKRQQDIEKLKELEKLRLELEQHKEFKTKILESKAMLQRELQMAKKAELEAIEARNLHAEEMADLAETVEMATLDKEMAEEKADSLLIEIQELKNKLEEVTLDYETLKAQLELGPGEGEAKELSGYEYKQLEQQNGRLKDSLLKMRDLMAHDKHEYQKLMKDMDQKKSEIAELSRTKKKLSSRVEELEEQVRELQDQVDAALGAEELVTTLGYDKIALQEKVAKLQEEIYDLEALEAANEQLYEEQKEIEVELNEKLDLTLSKLRECQREKEAALETVADRERTIAKFREAVTTLQEERQDLLSRLESALNKPVILPEVLDYKKVFSETIAHKRAIDLELRQMELKQKEQHIQFLTAFMPESFLGRGGDHDAILTFLLLSRFLWKCEIILTQIRDKFPAVEKVHRTAVVKEDTVIRYACRCRLSYYIHYVEMVLRQFLYGLDTCTPELLLRIGTKYSDLLNQERIIDGLIELIKADRLDENIATDSLERCGCVLDTVRLSAFGDTTTTTELVPIHHANAVRDACSTLAAACDACVTQALAIQSLAEMPDSNGDVLLLTQYIAVNLEVCSQQLKNIRRRTPSGEPVLNVQLSSIADLNTAISDIGRILRTLQDVLREARQAVLLTGDAEKGVALDKLHELFQTASDRYIDSEEESNLDAVKAIVSTLTNIVSKFNDIVEKTDFQLASPSEKTVERPIVLRAAQVKKELDQVKLLKKRLEDKDIDIKEAKISLKMKAEELSEMNIRKELLEKKLANFSKEQEGEVSRLKKELEATQEAFKIKEKDFEKTLDHLQMDIETLEKEKSELKEKFKVHKPTADASITKHDISLDKATSPTGVVGSDNDLALIQDLHHLRSELKRERLDKFRLECRLNSKKIKAVADMSCSRQDFKKYAEETENLMKEGIRLRKEIVSASLINVIDLSKVKPGEKYDPSGYFIDQFARRKQVLDKINQFSSKVSKHAAKVTRGGCIVTSLNSFATPEFKAALQEQIPVTVATIEVPVTADCSDAGKNVPLLVNLSSLNSILKNIAVPSV